MKDNNAQRPKADYAVRGPDPARGRSLTLRIVGYLTLALLPLGLISVLQSFAAIDAARASYRAALAGQTMRAARPEGEAIVRAFGIARGLVHAVPALIETPECSDAMARVAEDHPRIAFAGFVGADRVTRCNSAREVYDFSDNPDTERVFDAGVANVTFNPSGNVSGMAVVIVSVPVRDEVTNELLGFVSLSFPTRPLSEARAHAGLDDAVTLVTFDGSGRILTSDIDPAAVAELLPEGTTLADYAQGGERVFTARSEDGSENEYALAPIVDGQAYALGIWDAPDLFRSVGGLALRSVSFPLLMWLTGLAVAVLSLRRLVILPIRTLGTRMRAFADRREVFQANTLASAPLELQEIGASFETMANKIVRDEAELEDRVHEREVLLREVHHRVKNNLQLMSSIINMQIRQSAGAEAEDALRRVQGRLASLAKFHQDLYETSSLSRLRADQLLEDLARQMVAMSSDPLRQLDLRLDLDEIVLPPDQASPLAMLVTEALTNALKYADAAPDAPFYVALRMKAERETGANAVITVEVENSLKQTPPGEEGAGLGTRLIKAFAAQLGAGLDRIVDDNRYLVRLSFTQAPSAVH